MLFPAMAGRKLQGMVLLSRSLISGILGAVLFSSVVHGENWPCFRGPSRQGLSSETNLPLHWNSDSNIVWKMEIPGESWSSPIVWGEQIFITTATDNGQNCRILSLDRFSGRILWN